MNLASLWGSHLVFWLERFSTFSDIPHDES